MRYLLAFILSVIAIFAQAQQVNPVTDYTFANKMSAGRNTVTDTAAYFSVGPRHGAIRGMMPPIVTDTLHVVANKRNGLLIFSVQKNKLLLWDSAGAKWSDVTGTAGDAITSADTASMLAPYLRWADTVAMLLPYLRWADTTAMLSPYLLKSDTAAMLLPYLRIADTTAMLSPYLKESDTVWLSNRIDLKVNISDTATMLDPYLRGSGTANYLPIFDATRSVINSKVYESGTNLLFNTTTPSFVTSGLSAIENNATGAAVYSFKRADTLRAYVSMGSTNTFDINNLEAGDIRFYTQAQLRGRFQTDGTFRLNSLTGTGDRIVTADANGVLSATSSATGLVDTLVLSTRDWRQKGDDSLGAIIATKVNISDTATMLDPYALTSDVTAALATKQNTLTNPVTGTGTTNYVPKFTGTSTIGNSLIFDNGTNVGIGTASPSNKLDVSGTFQASGNSTLPGWVFNTSKQQIAVDSSSIIIFRRTTDNAGNFSIIPVRYQGLDVLRFRNSGGGESAIWLSNGRLSFAGGTTENMTLVGSELFVGHSGSPTDAGDYKLQVSGNAYVTGNALIGSTAIGNNTPFVTGSNIYTTASSLAIGTQGSNNITIYSNNTLFGTINTAQELIINSADSGSFKLQVGGGLIAGGLKMTTNSPFISGENIAVAGARLAIGTQRYHRVEFYTNGSERARFHENGGMRFIGQSAAPTAEAGTVYYDTDDNKLKVYNGTTWVDLH